LFAELVGRRSIAYILVLVALYSKFLPINTAQYDLRSPAKRTVELQRNETDVILTSPKCLVFLLTALH